MAITRNEFLRLIVEAHADHLDEIGNMDYWVDQHYLWTFDNVRDVRIHDTTAKVMAAWEAEQAGDEGDYDGQPDEYTEWQDYQGGDDWDHGQYDQGGY